MSGSVSVRQQQSRAPSHEGSTASTGGAAPSTTGVVGKSVAPPNIDDLFVKHSLSEIKMIERKFHHDIDRKREDLRLLVGERYKDVIDVSDKLMGITQHSTQIKDRLRNIESLCEKFQRQNSHQLSHSACDEQNKRKKKENDEERTKNSSRRVSVSSSPPVSTQVTIGCQLKLLSLIPEKILIFLDKGHLVKASQLVHLAHVIKDSLIGPLSGERQAIKAKFSIIGRISVQQMRSNISHTLTKQLTHIHQLVPPSPTTPSHSPSSSSPHSQNKQSLDKDNPDSPLKSGLEKAVSILAEVLESFCVLDNMTSSEAYLHCVEITSDHLKQFLEDDKSAKSVSDVLTSITRSMLVLFSCMSVLILSDDWGRKEESLKQKGPTVENDNNRTSNIDDAATCITNDVTAKSLFDVLYPQQTQLKRCLPPTITQFELRPVQLRPLDTEEFERRLRSCLQQNFIDKLKPLVEQQLKYVKNVKSLTNIKTQLLQMESELHGLREAELKRRFGGEWNVDFNPWKQLYEPLFLCSIKSIVKESALAQWSEVDTALTNHFLPLFDNKLKPKPPTKSSSPNRNGATANVPSLTSSYESVVANVNLDKATYLWNQNVSIDLGRWSPAGGAPKTGGDSGATPETSSPSHSSTAAAWTSASHSKMRTETPVIISIGQNLDDIVASLCEKTQEYFTVTSQLRTEGVPLPPRPASQNQNPPPTNSGATLSDVNVQVSSILISKLVDFIQSQNSENESSGSLMKLEVQIRLLNFICSSCDCVLQLKKNSHQNDLTSGVLGRLHTLIDTLQKRWVEKVTEEATGQWLPRTPLSVERDDDAACKNMNDLLSDTADIHCSLTKEQLVSPFMAACWEQVEITEETEEGQPVTTKLPIPIKASHPVHQVLYSVTAALNRVLPSTSPNEVDSKKCSQPGATKGRSPSTPQSTAPPPPPSALVLCDRLRETLLLKLAQYYHNQLHPFVKGNEDLCKDSKLMIQFVYDIKFISAILKTSAAESTSFTDSSIAMTTENLASLSNPPSSVVHISDVLALFEELIDPFDYDVYSSHLAHKLLQELNQSQHLYGFLMGSSSIARASTASSLAASAYAKSAAAGASHNVCDLVSAPVKFQPLSIPSNASFGLKRTMGSAVVSKAPSTATVAALSSMSTEKQSAGSSGSLLKSWFPTNKT